MRYQDPELVKAARLFAFLQWTAVIALGLMALAGILPLWLTRDGSQPETSQLGLVSIAALVVSAAITLPLIMLIRGRRNALSRVDALLQATAPRALELQRTFGFTGLMALRSLGRPSSQSASGAAIEPAWWLQPLVSKDRLPKLGRCPVQVYWQPPSAGDLLAWRAGRLGWGRVLDGTEIRRQGRQFVIVLVAFGLLVPLLIALIMFALMRSMSDGSSMIEPFLDLEPVQTRVLVAEAVGNSDAAQGYRGRLLLRPLDGREPLAAHQAASPSEAVQAIAPIEISSPRFDTRAERSQWLASYRAAQLVAVYPDPAVPAGWSLASEIDPIIQAQAELGAQARLLWWVLAVLPLLSLCLAALTWRETRRIAASALDPSQL